MSANYYCCVSNWVCWTCFIVQGTDVFTLFTGNRLVVSMEMTHQVGQNEDIAVDITTEHDFSSEAKWPETRHFSWNFIKASREREIGRERERHTRSFSFSFLRKEIVFYFPLIHFLSFDSIEKVLFSGLFFHIFVFSTQSAWGGFSSCVICDGKSGSA